MRAWGGYYERRSTLDEYLAYHYPGEDPLVGLLGAKAPALEERLPFAMRSLWESRPESLALDVGTACGRVALDLARDHRRAYGLDASRMLVAGAEEVRRTGRARYTTTIEGDLLREHEVPVPGPPRARFLLGDALALPFPDARFATVVALNLVDRVPHPQRALEELARVVEPGGLLLVGSPYTWTDKFTPRERWLGGHADREGGVRGFQTVRARLASSFELEEETERPFFIPHHARSGQLGVALIQKFRRRA